MEQTRDISLLMSSVAKEFTADYFMVQEDDMQFCRHTLRVIMYMVDKVSVNNKSCMYTDNLLKTSKKQKTKQKQANERKGDFWSALRFSFGLNGVLVHFSDVANMADYLIHSVARRPPDHLFVEWFLGETPKR